MTPWKADPAREIAEHLGVGVELLRAIGPVHLARRLVGVSEATGRNDGVIVRLFKGGYDDGAEWCGDFVRSVYDAAGLPLWRTVSEWWAMRAADYWQTMALERGAWVTDGECKPGDVISLRRQDSRQVDGEGRHVGLVVGVDGQGIETIEGNVGNAVAHRLYHPDSERIVGFVRPSLLL